MPRTEEQKRAAAAERKRRQRERFLKAGFVHVSVFVPAQAVPDLMTATATMRDHPHYTIGRLHDLRTGRMVSINGPLPKVNSNAAP